MRFDWSVFFNFFALTHLHNENICSVNVPLYDVLKTNLLHA